MTDLNEYFKNIDRLYKTSPDIRRWAFENMPNTNLIYKDGVPSQSQKINALNQICRYNFDIPKVVSVHRSKSVSLPVSAIKLDYHIGAYKAKQKLAPRAYLFIRDNFYDIKLCVLSNFKNTIPYEMIHIEWSQDRYDEQVKKSKGYQKDSSIDYSNDDWYKSWSNASIIRKNNRIYRAESVNSCYCEGISDLELPKEVFSNYTDDKFLYSISIGSYAKLACIIDYIFASKSEADYNTVHP